MQFSPPTLRLFRQLLDNVTLSGAAPDFEQLAGTVIVAKRELAAAEAEGAAGAATNGMAPPAALDSPPVE